MSSKHGHRIRRFVSPTEIVTAVWCRERSSAPLLSRPISARYYFPMGLLSNDQHGVVVHPLAVVTIHTDRVQLREPVDLYFGDFKNSVPPASSVGSARVSDPWARLSGTTQSARSTARSPSKTAQSCDSVVPRRDERRLQ